MEPERRIPMPLMDRVEEENPITHVDVINRNKFSITDRFNNEKFTFEPDQRVTITLDAARHIFGMDMEEEAAMLHCTRRFGWNTPTMMEGNRYMEYYRNLDVTPARFRLVRVADDPTYPEARRPGRPAKSRYKAPSSLNDDSDSTA